MATASNAVACSLHYFLVVNFCSPDLVNLTCQAEVRARRQQDLSSSTSSRHRHHWGPAHADVVVV